MLGPCACGTLPSRPASDPTLPLPPACRVHGRGLNQRALHQHEKEQPLLPFPEARRAMSKRLKSIKSSKTLNRMSSVLTRRSTMAPGGGDNGSTSTLPALAERATSGALSDAMDGLPTPVSPVSPAAEEPGAAAPLAAAKDGAAPSGSAPGVRFARSSSAKMIAALVSAHRRIGGGSGSDAGAGGAGSSMQRVASSGLPNAQEQGLATAAAAAIAAASLDLSPPTSPGTDAGNSSRDANSVCPRDTSNTSSQHGAPSGSNALPGSDVPMQRDASDGVPSAVELGLATDALAAAGEQSAPASPGVAPVAAAEPEPAGPTIPNAVSGMRFRWAWSP